MFNINFNMVCKILLRTLLFYLKGIFWNLFYLCVCVCEEKFIHLEKWLLRHQGTVLYVYVFFFIDSFSLMFS